MRFYNRFTRETYSTLQYGGFYDNDTYALALLELYHVKLRSDVTIELAATLWAADLKASEMILDDFVNRVKNNLCPFRTHKDVPFFLIGSEMWQAFQGQDRAEYTVRAYYEMGEYPLEDLEPAEGFLYELGWQEDEEDS